MKKHLPKSRTIKATFDYESGPVKIKDGLFMGDEQSARVNYGSISRILISL